MKNKIINIIILALLVISSLITLYVLNHREKGLEKLVVFGQEIEIEEGKQVYFVRMKSAKVKSISNGCEIPLQIEYNNGETEYSGGQYLVAGEKEAYFKVLFKDEKRELSNEVNYAYDLYVHVYLEEPLVIECERE